MTDDSISLRFEYSVPVLVTTKKGRKLATGYELKRFVKAHRIGVDDFEGPMFDRDAQKLVEMFRPQFEKKLQAEYGDWRVIFKGFAIMRHAWDEIPSEDDERWT